MPRNAFASLVTRAVAAGICAVATLACSGNGAPRAGAGSPHPKEAGGRAVLTRAQAIADIRFAESRLWALHPNLAFHRPKALLDADFARAERGITQPEKRTDLYRALASRPV